MREMWHCRHMFEPCDARPRVERVEVGDTALLKPAREETTEPTTAKGRRAHVRDEGAVAQVILAVLHGASTRASRLRVAVLHGSSTAQVVSAWL